MRCGAAVRDLGGLQGAVPAAGHRHCSHRRVLGRGAHGQPRRRCRPLAARARSRAGWWVCVLTRVGADALRKDVIKPSLYTDEPEALMVGMLAALIAAAAWLVLATFLKLPVSTTHGMGKERPRSSEPYGGLLFSALTRACHQHRSRCHRWVHSRGQRSRWRGVVADRQDLHLVGLLALPRYDASPPLGSQGPKSTMMPYIAHSSLVSLVWCSGPHVIHDVLPGPFLHLETAELAQLGLPFPAFLLRHHSRYVGPSSCAQGSLRSIHTHR